MIRSQHWIRYAWLLGLTIVTEVAARNDVNGLKAFEHFAAVPEFLESPAPKMPIGYSLENELAIHCLMGPIAGCLAFIENNKQSILKGQPDNPAYWQAFHQFMKGNPLPVDPATLAGLEKPYQARYKLVVAANTWVYRELALKGKDFSASRFVDYYKNVRRMLAASNILLDRMNFVAAVEIAHNNLSMLMALYASHNDLDSLRLLTDAIKPFSTQERSLRSVFRNEARFYSALIERADANDIFELTKTTPPPYRSLPELRDWARGFVDEEWQRLIEYVGLISERSADDYWIFGTTNSAVALPSEETPFHSMLDYIRINRQTELMVPLLQALGEYYLYSVVPAKPRSEAPATWTWSWRPVTSQLCLVPSSTAQSASAYTVDSPACVSYLQ